jgi:hypothetical protein
MSFDIHLDWSAVGAARDEGVADVRIAAHGHLLTQILDLAGPRYRDRFRASAVTLAFWFADNWWRLRWEPLGAPSMATIDWRLRHEMSSGSSNELWPPIMIYGGGPRVMVAPALGRRSKEGDLSYLEWKPLSVRGGDYETGVDNFLEQVMHDCAHHADTEALRSLVEQLSAERTDDALAGWRRLEACLGFDADQAPAHVVDAMAAHEDLLGEEAIEEAAVAAPGEGAPAALDAVLEAAAASNLEVDLSAVGTIRDIPDPHGLTPWRAAEEAARQLREQFGLPDVINNYALADLLQTRWEDLKAATATARYLPYAARAPRHGETSRVALKMVPQIDRRFELARVIGDALWSRGQGMGVISRARTDRQKYQRAFAQSLLCPIRSLARTIDLSNPTEAQIQEAAQRHRVREAVIVTILVNRGFLVREGWHDLLEAA